MLFPFYHTSDKIVQNQWLEKSTSCEYIDQLSALVRPEVSLQLSRLSM